MINQAPDLQDAKDVTSTYMSGESYHQIQQSDRFEMDERRPL